MTRIVVPAREGRAFRVAAGPVPRDRPRGRAGRRPLLLRAPTTPREYLSAEHTGSRIGRLLAARSASQFETNRRRAILTLGRGRLARRPRHALRGLQPSRYRLLRAEGRHASCEENLRAAMAGSASTRHRDPAAGQPLRGEPDRCRTATLGIEPAPSRGRRSPSRFRAELDSHRRRHRLPAGPDAALRWLEPDCGGCRDRRPEQPGSSPQGPRKSRSLRQSTDADQ